jgi:hypothetical protein
MKRPTDYYVEYIVPDEWGDARGEIRDCATLSEAKRIFKVKGGRIMERFDIMDDTPSTEPFRGLMWNWQEREILS